MKKTFFTPTALLVLLLTLFCGCDKELESDFVYTDDTTEECQLYDYYVDEYGNEGVVAYIASSDGIPSKVIVISADETRLPWGPTGEVVYKSDTVKTATVRDVSFGVAMLQSMKANGIERYPAQAWCDRKNQGEKHVRGGSWRLPTDYELRLICGSVTANTASRVPSLNKALAGIGGTKLSEDERYWTCVEDYSGYAKLKDTDSDYDEANRALVLTPENKTSFYKNEWIKKNKYNVRAIKYVYFVR